MSTEHDANTPQSPRTPNRCRPGFSRYTEALPSIRAGMMSPAQRDELLRHIARCPVCASDREAAESALLDVAIRRQYGVPEGRAPFVSLDDIRARVERDDPSSLEAPPQSLPHQSQDWLSIPAESSSGSPRRDAFATIAGSASRGRGRAAVVVAAAVAALFALLLHIALPASLGSRPTPPTPTPVVLQLLGTNGKWAASGSPFTMSSQNEPVHIAPSDPQVLYKYGSTGTTAMRSDNGGTTWVEIDAPSDKVSSVPNYGMSLTVSPLDAHTIFANVSSELPNPNCPTATSPANPQIARASGVLCSFGYVSMNGGATWQSLVTPFPGAIALVSFGQAPLQAQGRRLYAMLSPMYYGQFAGLRLVASDDGVHWSLADTTLANQGHSIDSFVAESGGHSIFATTRTGASTLEKPNASRLLWRSDDAGATWKNLGPFQVDDKFLYGTLLTAAAQIGGKTLAYYTTMQYPTIPGLEVPLEETYLGFGVPTLHVSVDGGVTWQSSPSAGLPKGEYAHSRAVGTLADGTVVMQFASWTSYELPSQAQVVEESDPAMYGWKPGDSSWVQLTPVLQGDAGPTFSVLLQSAGGQQVSAWTTIVDGLQMTLESCPLTA